MEAPSYQFISRTLFTEITLQAFFVIESLRSGLVCEPTTWRQLSSPQIYPIKYEE